MPFGTPQARFQITAEDKSDAAFRSVKKNLSNVKSGFQGVTRAIGPLIGAAGFGMLAKNVISFGSEIHHMSQRLGISGEALQALRHGASEAGASTSDLERALRNVKLRVQDAHDGAKNYAEALQRLGLDSATMLQMPMEQQMEAIAKAYTGALNPAEAFNDVVTILGERAGPALIEVLQRIATEGFAGLKQATEETVGIISDKTAKTLADTEDRLAKYKTRVITAAAGGLDKLDTLATDLAFSYGRDPRGVSKAALVGAVRGGIPLGFTETGERVSERIVNLLERVATAAENWSVWKK